MKEGYQKEGKTGLGSGKCLDPFLFALVVVLSSFFLFVLLLLLHT